MKKFRIELLIETRQYATYEVEAESREHLDELLEMNCVEDIGTCTDETPQEQYNEEIGHIEEVQDDNG